MRFHSNTTFSDLAHSVSRRIPMCYRLGTGLKVRVANRSQHSTFWGLFSSAEYFSILPALQWQLERLAVDELVILDCGAHVGMFSLFMEHCARLGLLTARLAGFHCVEANPLLGRMLRHNLAQLANAQVYDGCAGRSQGECRLLIDTTQNDASHVGGDSSGRGATVVPYVDLRPLLELENIFLKLDIEGSEFACLEEYRDDLANVLGLVIEWHPQFAAHEDLGSGREILNEAGFTFSRSTKPPKARQPVELWLRSTSPIHPSKACPVPGPVAILA